MLHIYLSRHGQNEDNAEGILNGHRDRPLTAIGIEQAQQLATHIEKLGLTFDAVYSSPLCRAYATAEIVTKKLGLLDPQKMPLLIERDFGVMTGKLVKDIALLCAPNIIKTNIVTYFLTAENAETFPQLLERAKRALQEIKDAHADDENILLVSHGDLGKMLYAAYYNLDWKDILTMFHFGNSELLLLSEDSKAADAHVFTIKQHNH
ncbi:MAG: hypothetical protein ACD_81C00185G0008 [uncultured bacterium]|uniref:Phosphoglycerate mutase n=2 Tax=Candidatus Wolfeibacteriota TaxID=1752735 RepID=A0A0G1HAF5_9BACT|nr:MAG: hypothetical protein ACD_81C00185G0008 [uncultured bacterium]KKR12814.1 MAG: hypothetical protein UT41_C0001G0358 [Candidatus Wolfebacteria bacterium GW2011_GWC2_39_22]KKT43745.1 MAG: hypothetical protein UW32_C0001G0337 [Candidatus Wolfebacteria bacterium GW2011_GWE2_44_13]HBI25524.1 histidine phosphatase family protein [Candidatus Wolfebacteria bacterium]